MSKRKNKGNWRGKRGLNVTFYTDELYFECFPERTEEDYAEFLCADWDAYASQTEKQVGYKFDYVRKVVIDEEYLQWIEAEGKENTSENRIAYINQVSDEDAVRLWENNGFDAAVVSYALPFALASHGVLPSGSIRFDEAHLEGLKNLLSKTYGVRKEDMMIWNELMRPDYYVVHFMDWFEDKASEHFYFTGEEEETEPLRPDIRAQSQTNIGTRVLPVVFFERELCIVPRHKLNEEMATERVMNERELGWWTKRIKPSGADFQMNPFPFLLLGEEAPEFHEDFAETVRMDAEESGLEFRLV